MQAISMAAPKHCVASGHAQSAPKIQTHPTQSPQMKVAALKDGDTHFSQHNRQQTELFRKRIKRLHDILGMIRGRGA